MVSGGGNVNKFAIHLDVVARVGLRAEVSAGFTVDSDPARRDQFVAMPARSETRSGKETIEAHIVKRIRYIVNAPDSTM